MEVSLMQMLDAREARARRQRELLAQYGTALICFTMNIPGPEKDSPLIRQGYALGKKLLRQQLDREGAKVIHFEEKLAHTGCEAMYAVDCPPVRIKNAMVAIEEASVLGRLFDMDVLGPDGKKTERKDLGLESRKCLICGAPAAVCGRSRTHSVAELQEKTRQLLEAGITGAVSGEIAALAVQALLYEVGTTPKPGLVDRDNSGSHRDMDFFTFQASAAALWPYFQSCGRIGMETRERAAGETFEKLRLEGILAEGSMLAATGGVNTHKGAIFSLGILCGALGRVGMAQWKDPHRVLAECGAMTQGLTRREFAGLTEETARTAGQKLYLRHGITGVRGQAEAGFPAVGQVGLPKLRQGLARGLSINEAGCAALLAMMACGEDTNIISRSDLQTQRRVASDIRLLLEKDPFPAKEVLRELNETFVEKNLSPGGTADLLAMVYLLYLAGERENG